MKRALVHSKPSIDACWILLSANCYTTWHLSFLICKVETLYLGTAKVPSRPGFLDFGNSSAEGQGLACQALKKANTLKLSVLRSRSREKKEGIDIY